MRPPQDPDKDAKVVLWAIPACVAIGIAYWIFEILFQG